MAFATAQALIGGTRLLFALPAYALLGAAAALGFFARNKRRGQARSDAFCLLTTAFFAGVIIARAWWSPVVYLARPDLLMAVAALAVYGLTTWVVTDPKLRVWLLVGLLALSLAQLGAGAAQFARGDNFMLLRWEGTLLNFARSTDYTGRASGFYICPNHLAGNLEVVGVMTLAVALWGRLHTWAKLLLGYFSLACFLGLLLTGSRGGFLSAGVALAVFALLSVARARAIAPERSSWMLASALAAAALLVIGVLFFAHESDLLHRRAQALFTTKIQDVRPYLWAAAWKQFSLAPWAGTGSGTYLYFGRLLRDPSVQMDPVHAHGDYLELLAEYGIAGGVAMVLFLIAHGHAGIRDFQLLRTSALWGAPDRPTTGSVSSNAAALNLGALAALASYLAHSVVDFNLHIPVNALLLAWVCGILANPGRDLAAGSAGSGAGRDKLTRLLPRLALPALGASLLVAAWLFLPGEYFAESARVALRDGEYLRSVNAARAGVEVAVDDPNLYYYLGESRLLQAGSVENSIAAHSFYEGAVEAFAAGHALFPQDTRINLRLGLALDEMSDYAAAERVFEETLRWDPNSGRVWTYYAAHLQRQGFTEAARSAYGRAVQLAAEPAAHAALERLGPVAPARAPTN